MQIMDTFLRADDTNIAHLANSPTNSFIADEIASICPLITPSPPTNDLINPLPGSNEPNYEIGEELATILQQVKEKKENAEDSTSSGSSAMAEPACTQLLNHRNNYYHIQKDEITAATEETAGKVQPLQLTFRNPPDNYFFMSWNWPFIRRVSLWLFLSSLVAMVALVITMISTLPRTCNPHTKWFQGGIIYEVFPASFYDSDGDMIGDLKGMSQNVDYIMSLGVVAVRLNSIFATTHYPEDYCNVSNLIEIAKPLGDLNDFQIFVKHLKSRNISLILDLPIFPLIRELNPFFNIATESSNNETTKLEPSLEFLKSNFNDIIEDALFYWTKNGVDGFYIKGLEHLVGDPNLGSCLRRWKRILGEDRPIIINEKVISSAHHSVMNIILNNVDLIDIHLHVEKGVAEVSKQIEAIQNGTLFSRPGMPWILWNIGDERSTRLANILPYSNATLGATLLQLMLPGTPSIFYGNEIGLQQIQDPEGERYDLKHLHQLPMMIFPNKSKPSIHAWIHGIETHTNFDQMDIISKMATLRAESPSIYINAVVKQGDNKANAEVKYSKNNLLVIQRWYPRRKSYVIVSNFGNSKLSADLSKLLYSGDVLIGPRANSHSESISFKAITLWPGESVVILLN